MSRSLEFNDVCGKVCVCVCVCVFVQRKGRFALGLSLLKSCTSGLVIWEGCCAGQTHTDRENEGGGGGGMFLLCLSLSLY